jgi:hypothetical protein
MKGVTDKQFELLKLVKRAAGEPSADFDQVLEALSWKPTKQSAQFTIRACIDKGLMEKAGLQLRRGRKRVCYALTKAGREVLDPRPVVSVSLPAIPELSVEANPEVFDSPDEEVVI